MAYGSLAHDETEKLEIGDVRFLVKCQDEKTRKYSRFVMDEPPTDMQDRICLTGWIGVRYGVIQHAAGVARVVGVEYDYNSDYGHEERLVRVVPVAPTKLRAALKRLGYGELA